MQPIMCLLAWAGAIMGQGTIHTYAGSDKIFADSGQPAAAAHLLGPNGVEGRG